MTETITCGMCGKEERLHWSADVEAQLRERKLCFGCNFWENQARKGCDTVIDGFTYGPGNRTSGSFRGMAGRRFDIEYFDGRKVTTYDLWGGGEIPEAFRDRLPDTARFRGAERAKVGETICWNPTLDDLPPYPLPNGRPAPWPRGDAIVKALSNVAPVFVPHER